MRDVCLFVEVTLSLVSLSILHAQRFFSHSHVSEFMYYYYFQIGKACGEKWKTMTYEVCVHHTFPTYMVVFFDE